MQNPLRDEGSAFFAVLVTLGVAALTVIGAWIEPWLGVVVFIGAALATLAAFRGQRRDRAVPLAVSSPDGRRRLLVVANETVAGAELLGLIASRVKGRPHDVLVVSPALNTKLATWVYRTRITPARRRTTG